MYTYNKTEQVTTLLALHKLETDEDIKRNNEIVVKQAAGYLSNEDLKAFLITETNKLNLQKDATGNKDLNHNINKEDDSYSDDDYEVDDEHEVDDNEIEEDIPFDDNDNNNDNEEENGK